MHKTVLLKESVEALNLSQGAIVVDATLGSGGHTLELSQRIGDNGRIIAFDLDSEAINGFKKKIRDNYLFEGKFTLINENFSQIERLLLKKGFFHVDGILADLGWRIEQIEDASYGMSFLKKGPLDMRLGRSGELTAEQIINNWSESDLTALFLRNGEERGARRMAREILKEREQFPIRDTLRLASLANSVLGASYKKNKIHPATKIFQALRMEVNQELGNIEDLIRSSVNLLKPGGRLAIISFHSIEDRLVKRIFQELSRGCICPRELPVCVCNKKPQAKIINKRAIMPSAEELGFNPRSRSAKLRILEKNNF